MDYQRNAVKLHTENFVHNRKNGEITMFHQSPNQLENLSQTSLVNHLHGSRTTLVWLASNTCTAHEQH